ncbi:HAD superfamily hydrolase [Streptococcus pneumoniae]|nr:HAD superfamily hydrolase [Streptococcus pneumoniae]VJW12595.1 HAD superfamily hydrolase [Streptococcus pneumoniae]VMH42371.1 HAD superfamily hydrolase [Streptococcus pneumoniae]VMN00733.1 HAD superfamily hydrolase [Streptococcus pneumoniae]VNC50486.1 HAD superfamily hydrolase [Streptococcus pneumoniae]
MKKIIFLDVDGTIVDYDNHIPDSAKIAIQQSRKNGHFVFLCTGRSKAEMPNEILDIGFDGIIGGNGSYIE